MPNYRLTIVCRAQVYATVNIDDSNEMKELTKATVKDSAAMKLIAILTLIYLPPTFATVSASYRVTSSEVVRSATDATSFCRVYLA